MAYPFFSDDPGRRSSCHMSLTGHSRKECIAASGTKRQVEEDVMISRLLSAVRATVKTRRPRVE